MHVLKRIATIVVRSSRPAGMEPSEGAASTIGASDHRRFSPIRKYTRRPRPPQLNDLKDVATQTSPRSSPVRVGNKKIMHILKGCDEGFDTRHSMPEIIQLLEQDGLCYRCLLYTSDAADE